MKNYNDLLELIKQLNKNVIIEREYDNTNQNYYDGFLRGIHEVTVIIKKLEVL